MSVFQGVYSPEIANSAFRSTAERATETLNEFADPYDPFPIFAEWDLTRKGNGPALQLRLKKDQDEVTAVFQISDLIGDKGWTEMNHAYGRLLDVRIRRSLAAMSQWDNSNLGTAEDD